MRKHALWILVCTITACAPGQHKKRSSYSYDDAFISPLVPASLKIEWSRVSKRYLDGERDDLATAGIGLDAIRNNRKPEYSAPPSAAELRKLAYFQNIRSLFALSRASGFGEIYAESTQAFDAGAAVSGYEYIIPILYDNDRVASVAMLHMPSDFDWSSPCLVVSASSALRGVYGAVGVVGFWALNKKCAVVYSDKGTGTGFHWLDENVAVNVDGPIGEVNQGTHFFVERQDGTVKNKAHRIATKHAHSGRNSDKDWGQFVNAATYFAFELINREFQPRVILSPKNTLVIGAGISNGGGAVLKAAEQDTNSLFDGIVISEPNIFIPDDFRYQWREGRLSGQHKPLNLLQNASLQSIYLPCAALFHDASDFPEPFIQELEPLLSYRCQRLAELGLLSAQNLRSQSDEALEVLIQAGYPVSANALAVNTSRNMIWNALLFNFTSAIGRYRVDENLCDQSYAYADKSGKPIATPDSVKRLMYGLSSASVPGFGVQIIDDAGHGGERSLPFSLDKHGRRDWGLDNLLCLKEAVDSVRVRQGLSELSVTGNLHGLPTVIVHGEADGMIQVRNTSRAYLMLNAKQSDASNLRYYEVRHAQHADILVQFPPFKRHFVPLHPYFEQSLNLMYTHLTQGGELPASRVVHTKTMDPSEVALTKASIPSITSSRITPINIEGGVLVIAN